MKSKKNSLSFKMPEDIHRDLPFIPKSQQELKDREHPPVSDNTLTNKTTQIDTSIKADTGIKNVTGVNLEAFEGVVIRSLDNSLTKSERSIYLFLLRLAVHHEDLMTGVIGYAEISKAIQVVLLTVKRSIRKLKAGGLLNIKDQFNTADKKGSVYQVILPNPNIKHPLMDSLSKQQAK
jgi:hypothetical protein